MGLDTTHNCWHGSYGSFASFRKYLASKIDVNLDDCIGFRERENKNPYIDLRKINHGIIPLLDHSDCDGELSPDECKQIAKGLTEILKKIPSEEKKAKPFYIESILQFKKGCLSAVKKNEFVQFM